MMTESTPLPRLIAEVLRLSAADVESDERWAGVAELRQLDAEKIYQIAAGLCTSSFLIERELGADLLGWYTSSSVRPAPSGSRKRSVPPVCRRTVRAA